ncbi:hypothetical protein SPURM210S_04375 [Streptomyces purpurascens]
MHSSGRDEILGTAYSDHDLVVFLEGAGVAEPEAVLDGPQRVEWRGGHAKCCVNFYGTHTVDIGGEPAKVDADC